MSASETDLRVRWSIWSRCASSFDLWLVPDTPGVYVLAEEVIAPGAALGEKRMLAVLEVGAADGLARTLGRLFIQPTLRDRLAEGHCFVRYTVIHDAEHRGRICAALQNYLTGDSTPVVAAQSAAAAALATAGF